ncbi:MAG: TetR/AcrR family transcriptional regulator [Bacteroidales bacterium]|jgi:AcrR family transcriptional regulator|nr:TetR/AcrR family transcriptional regulator [Bacteroidales bacterium]
MTKADRQTEERIFEAATEIFEEKGLAAARMQDIADRANINKALLHYYFRSKDKLFTAVFDKLSDKMFKKFAAIFEEDMPFEEKIRYFFKEHISFLQKNPKLPLFILTEVNRNPELLQKFLSRVNIKNIKAKMSGDLSSRIPEEAIPHLMVSIISLSVFPIAAEPIIRGILQQEEIDYDSFIKERMHVAPEFIISALKQYMVKPKNKPGQ